MMYWRAVRQAHRFLDYLCIRPRNILPNINFRAPPSPVSLSTLRRRRVYSIGLYPLDQHVIFVLLALSLSGACCCDAQFHFLAFEHFAHVCQYNSILRLGNSGHIVLRLVQWCRVFAFRQGRRERLLPLHALFQKGFPKSCGQVKSWLAIARRYL